MATTDLYEQRRISIRNELNTALQPALMGSVLERLVLLGMSPKKAVNYGKMILALKDMLHDENNTIHGHREK